MRFSIVRELNCTHIIFYIIHVVKFAKLDILNHMTIMYLNAKKSNLGKGIGRVGTTKANKITNSIITVQSDLLPYGGGRMLDRLKSRLRYGRT